MKFTSVAVSAFKQYASQFSVFRLRGIMGTGINNVEHFKKLNSL